MNREEVKTRINQSLANVDIQNADIRVQPDGFGAWKIAVVTPKFEGLTVDERKLAAGIDGISYSWIDLLSPAESKWAGSLPADVEPDQLPLWPEALGKANTEIDIPVFASDLDIDIDGPAITTFYSLRGGVGRSTALACTAKILASRGRRVVCIDMDLEAPGLASLFGVDDHVMDASGVVQILTALDNG